MTARIGAIPHDNGVWFRVWAPAQTSVSVVVDGHHEYPLSKDDEGYFSADVPGLKAGQRYQFKLRQGLRPDPASRFQPEGPLGPSEIIDGRRFPWTDQHWKGVTNLHRQVIYEMHIGTFTAEGTWASAAARLPSLVDIGITTLEVMPIAEFAGRFGWGYDGVDLFAPTRLYGTPDDAKRFVNVAHELGLAVILDVVYNHFGPVGNFLSDYSPMFQGQPGEWGDLTNFDGHGRLPVRAFMTENAAYWIGEFHFDGLRFDATQAILDSSAEHVVSEICRVARKTAGNRTLFLVGESEPQDTRLLKASGAYPDGLDAIWSEDWHHSAYVALTGRRQAYFTDYLGNAAELASMVRHGILYQGQWYTWQTNPRGRYALGLPISSFVSFLENHDQVANTGLASRLYHQVDRGRWRALTALLLLGPTLPMLFQGQEFGSTRPFNYFADHDGELGVAVEAGRSEFLAQFPGLDTPEMLKRLPKPGDPATFEACKLSDEERGSQNHHVRLHRDLIRLRREDSVLQGVGTELVRIESSAPSQSIVLVRYIAAEQHRLLVVNLGDDHLSPMNDPLLAPLPGHRWALVWSSEHPDYGGGGAVPFVEAGRWLIRARMTMVLATESI